MHIQSFTLKNTHGAFQRRWQLWFSVNLMWFRGQSWWQRRWGGGWRREPRSVTSSQKNNWYQSGPFSKAPTLPLISTNLLSPSPPHSPTDNTEVLRLSWKEKVLCCLLSLLKLRIKCPSMCLMISLFSLGSEMSKPQCFGGGLLIALELCDRIAFPSWNVTLVSTLWCSLWFIRLREAPGGAKEMSWKGCRWVRGQPTFLALANQP